MKNKNYSLVKTFPIFFGILILCGTFTKQAVSQENEIRYALVEYFKVKPENTEKYLEFSKNFWRPLQMERIAQKEIVGWRLYRIQFTGTNDEYNFVTAAFFDDFNKLEKVYNIDIQKVHPGRNINDTMEEIYKVRDLVKTNLLVVNNGTVNNTAFKYIQVNFMNVKQGEENEYLDVEDSIWKPVHQELVDNRAKAGWSLWSLVFPNGSGLPYQFLAVDDFTDFSQIGNVNYSDVFSKVHKDKNLNELYDRTNNSRILVKSELWESLDAIFPQK